jgi:hypothetical protein
MDGPSRESYLAARKRRQERRDALRTRDGVVDLAEWRTARRAVTGLLGLLDGPPWLLDVRLAPAADVGLEPRVTMLWDDAQGRMCLRTSVDEIPVRVIVRNPDARCAGRPSQAS